MYILLGSHIIVTIDNFRCMPIVSDSSEIDQDKNRRNKKVRLGE